VDSAVVVIVGAGPRGTSVLERLAANVPEVAPDLRVHVHVVDPYPPGAGRVWRHDQWPTLRVNSMAEDVTMFTDETVRCEGPVRPGPSMAEWADAVRVAGLATAELTAEVRSLTATSFPTRRLQSAYLSWVFDHVVENLPDGISACVHPATVVDVREEPDGCQTVTLDDGSPPLRADAVVFAIGHLDAEPDGETARVAASAADASVVYLPPAYTAELDLSALVPGEDVIVRGIGLACVDLVALVTEGRGGRFERGPEGGLVYLPSGEEPRLWLGSRRGVPYRCKPTYRLRGSRPALPRFLAPERIDAVLTAHERVDFRRHVWPLVAQEIGWGYYHELFTGHPERVTMSLEEFEERYTAATWGSAEMVRLVANAVPAHDDRLDLEALDRPLRGLAFPSRDALDEHLRRHMRADVDRRSDPTFSADLGGFYALLSVFGQLPRFAVSGQMAARSRVADMDGWWFGFFSYYASGPPAERLEQWLALSRAGIIRFLGGDTEIEIDAERRRARAWSASAPGVVEARAVVDARLPAPSVQSTADPLLRALECAGAIGEEILHDSDGEVRTGAVRVSRDLRLLDRSGRPHPRRFAAGPATTARGAAFTRPRSNGVAFRQNDTLARAVLSLLADTPITTKEGQSRAR
jgi:uncharacterized NAD(P)/FAD-binding protein YdhS